MQKKTQKEVHYLPLLQNDFELFSTDNLLSLNNIFYLSIPSVLLQPDKLWLIQDRKSVV